MQFISAEEAARRWNVTTRLVQRYCKRRRIAGDEKLGGSWRIPEGAAKPAWPDDFKRMIGITYRFSAGWRRVHNPSKADDVADNLTTTEFAVCMLASRDCSNAEIAEHIGFSMNRVKECLSNAFRKLGVSSRKDLAQFMLA